MNQNGPVTSDRVAYPAWDRTTRIFHWVNVLCVMALATLGLAILNAKSFGVSGDGKVLLKTLHVYVGYVFVISLVWRIVWAFVGSQRARWKSLLPFHRGFVTSLREYVRGSAGGVTPNYVGHNPVGRLMVTVLLLLLVTQAATGLVIAGTDLYKPPFGGAIAEWVTAGDKDKLSNLMPGSTEFVDQAAYDEMRKFRKPIVRTHEYSSYVLLLAIFLHILGVIVTEIRGRTGLVSAMISGEKVVSEAPIDADRIL